MISSKWKKISLDYLGLTVFGGLFMVPILGYFGKRLYQNKLQDLPSYQEAINSLLTFKNIDKLLGDKIVPGKVDIADKQSYGSNEYFKWYKVPITGNKASGDLYFWTTNTENPDILKIQLNVTKPVELSLLIKDDNDGKNNK